MKRPIPEYHPNIVYDEFRKCFWVESEGYIGHKYRVHYSHQHEQLICECPWGRGQAIQRNMPCKHIEALFGYLMRNQDIQEVRT